MEKTKNKEKIDDHSRNWPSNAYPCVLKDMNERKYGSTGKKHALYEEICFHVSKQDTKFLTMTHSRIIYFLRYIEEAGTSNIYTIQNTMYWTYFVSHVYLWYLQN